MSRKLTKWVDQNHDSKCPFCGEINETNEDCYLDGNALEIECWNCSQEFYADVEVVVHVHDGWVGEEKIAEWKSEQAGEYNEVNNGHT